VLPVRRHAGTLLGCERGSDRDISPLLPALRAGFIAGRLARAWLMVTANLGAPQRCGCSQARCLVDHWCGPQLSWFRGEAGVAEKVQELLAEARALLPHRLSPAEALEAQANGALLIDIRGDDQRRAGGLIPGAVVVPRNVLEWRCDPASPWRHATVRRSDQVIVLVCHEGFQSSLAAATLQRLGLRNATDLDGGFAAWREAGLPVEHAEVVPS
jgi:rhodanese-related sulfurtransferase